MHISYLPIEDHVLTASCWIVFSQSQSSTQTPWSHREWREESFQSVHDEQRMETPSIVVLSSLVAKYIGPTKNKFGMYYGGFYWVHTVVVLRWGQCANFYKIGPTLIYSCGTAMSFVRQLLQNRAHPSMERFPHNLIIFANSENREKFGSVPSVGFEPLTSPWLYIWSQALCQLSYGD